MFTASEKRKSNIAEYLLYMWQIEDLIRANGLDIDKINENIISRYKGLSEEQLKQMKDWYESLIDMMRSENVSVSGHLQINKNIIAQLDELNSRLIRDPKFAAYAAEYYHVLPYIVEVRAKAGENKSGEIESCFNILYGILLLRLQHKEISKETLEAAGVISKFLARLAAYFVKDEEGTLFQNDDK